MNNSNCSDVKQVNHLLNFLKGLACIGVVFMHFHFPEPYGSIIIKISAFAVPLFLMIAGYYSYKKDLSTIKRRLVKIAKIFFYAFVLFTVYSFISHCYTYDLIVWLVQEFRFKTLLKLVVFCTIDYAIPLWYLIAMLQTYIFWYLVVKANKVNFLVKTIPIIFIAQFILTSCVETLNLEWCLKINFITRALSWFLLGYYINANKEHITKIPNIVIIIGGLAGLGISLSHILLKTSIDISCVGTFVYSLALFIIGIKYSNAQLSNTFEYIGENLSLYIYIYHYLIGSLIISLTKIIFNINIRTTWYTPIIIALVTILVSYLRYRAKISLYKKQIQ